MKIIIFGGGGFLGRKLATKLLEVGELVVNGQPVKAISQLILFDKFISNAFPEDTRLTLVEGDICNRQILEQILAQKPDVIYHLAAVVSGEAEKDFDLGMAVNLQASWDMLEICRALQHSPVFIFTSSCAVFGGDVKEPILDRTASTPKNSYGTQKAIVDLLINDYSRRGWINGRALRLPTIVVRPGKPNAATTSLVSGIIREPLQGQRAKCPVEKNTSMWVLSPNKIIHNFIHATALTTNELGPNRHINIPGITVTVQDMVNSLKVVGGQKAVNLIDFEPDAFIESIVLTFPPYFITKRADALGFQKNNSFTEIIEEFVQETV